MKRLNILMCFLVLTGCASIIRDNTQIVPIQANVENAKIEVTNSSGAVVYSGQTPTTVYLKSSKSGYFNPENLNIHTHTLCICFTKLVGTDRFRQQERAYKCDPDYHCRHLHIAPAHS